MERFPVEEIHQLNLVNNLKHLAIRIKVSKEHLLTEVMQKFQKLTHLKLWLITNAVNKALKDFPFNQNILDMNITFRVSQDFDGMCYSLKQIAIKCP